VEIPLRYRDLIGLLARERVAGPNAGRVRARLMESDPQVDRERERLTARFTELRAELGPTVSHFTMFQELRHRELSLSTSPLLDTFDEEVPGRTNPLPLFDENKKPDKAAFVSTITYELYCSTLTGSGDLMLYKEGIYVPGEHIVIAWIERAFRHHGRTANSGFVREVVEGVKRRTFVDPARFNRRGVACLLNGILDLQTFELRPHTPAEHFTVKLPVAFDPHAECPVFNQFLTEVLLDQPDRDAVQRLFGYVLERGNRFQRAFMLVGEGNNGKSTLLGVLEGLLGRDGYCSETLQTLSENRFAPASLWSKYANICADIPARAIQHTGVFKMLTGGDPVRAEKKFRDAFTFFNDAKLIFSANELPQVDDRTIAFWRRWVLIPFPVDFTGREDRDLPAKLQLELSGILNWALDGLRKVRESGFPGADGTIALKEEWKRRSDSVYYFGTTSMVKDPTAWMETAALYGAYVEFCEERDATIRSQDAFSKSLPRVYPAARKERGTVAQGRKWGWRGIALRAPTNNNAEEVGQVGQPGQRRLPEPERSDVSEVSDHSGTNAGVPPSGGREAGN
jgi:putative DNA primase/helicase